ncbi:MAG TPA: pyridoxal-phosphate dependent enzyme [Gaiellaceae bacterium]|nr:pyridoxal-phosphate dependent enzyme [Gaiellaceae bacterium]
MGAPTPLETAPVALARGREVYLKREDAHELGAFKWRGALPALERFRGEGATGVVTASTGNHGAATAWAAAGLGLTATVFVPEAASRTKLGHLIRLGAEVVETGADLDEAKDQAVAYATGVGLPFFEDGAEPAQLDGYAAIGDEILDQLEHTPATVVVPVGNGALLAGVGRALGARAPATRRIGVVSAGAPVMAQSWRAGHAVECDLCETIADGLAVRVAIPLAVEWLLAAADEMMEVSEPEIAAAVAAFDDAGVRAEAAAAAALAALPHVEADGPVVLVVTGRNIDDDLLASCHEAAERPRAQ